MGHIRESSMSSIISAKLNKNMLNSLVASIVIATAIFPFLPYAAAAIGTANTTSNNATVGKAASISTTNATTFGNPLYVLHEKIIGRNVVNSTGDVGNQHIQLTWNGSGIIRGIKVTDSGQMLINYGPPAHGVYKIPLYASGHGILTSMKNETAGYTFQSIAYTDKNQTSRFNGFLVFTTLPTIGRLGFLGTPNNMIGMYRSDIPSNGNVTTTVWPWRH